MRPGYGGWIESEERDYAFVRYPDGTSHYWHTGARGRAVDMVPADPFDWIAKKYPWLAKSVGKPVPRSAGDDSNRDLSAFVQPDPGALDDVVEVAADDDLVVRRDRGRFHRSEYGSVGGHLRGVHFDFPPWSGSEEAAVDRHLSAAAWDRITERIEAWRVSKDHGLGITGSESHDSPPED